MSSWIAGGIVGAIAGGIAAYKKVSGLAKEALARPCPRCSRHLEGKKPGRRTRTQVIWGGWTCPHCGCDIDRFGKERATN
jgi:hypothetical protein